MEVLGGHRAESFGMLNQPKPAAARTAVFSVSKSKKKLLEEERRQCGHEKVHVKHVEVKKYKWGMKPGGPQLTFVRRKY